MVEPRKMRQKVKAVKDLGKFTRRVQITLTMKGQSKTSPAGGEFLAERRQRARGAEGLDARAQASGVGSLRLASSGGGQQRPLTSGASFVDEPVWDRKYAASMTPHKPPSSDLLLCVP